MGISGTAILGIGLAFASIVMTRNANIMMEIIFSVVICWFIGGAFPDLRCFGVCYVYYRKALYKKQWESVCKISAQ